MKHTHTHTVLGILFAQLPASDRKKKEAWHVVKDGERAEQSCGKREICYNMLSLIAAPECSDYSHTILLSVAVGPRTHALHF